MIKKLILLFLTAANFFLAGENFSEKIIADQIVNALEVNYNRKECSSNFEKLLMEINKKSYFKLLNSYKNYYYDIAQIRFDNEPVLNDIIKILEKNTDDKTVEEFKKLIHELKLICVENFKLYFDAVNENIHQENPEKIDCFYIDNCMLNLKYFNLQKNLYEKEYIKKERINSLLNDKRVKLRLSFYIFIFEFASKQRKKTIDRLLNNYIVNINNKDK